MIFRDTYDKPGYYSTPFMLYKDGIHYLYSHLCRYFYYKFNLLFYDLFLYKKWTKLLDCYICYGKGGLYLYIAKFECIQILYIIFYCINYIFL